MIRPCRGAKVVEEVMAGHRPQFWVSDLYSAQQNHAKEWQVCLSHQLRDCESKPLQFIVGDTGPWLKTTTTNLGKYWINGCRKF